MIPEARTSHGVTSIFLRKIGPLFRQVIVYDNADTAVPYERLGNKDEFRDFRRTYNFEGEFINSAHSFYDSCPLQGNRIDIGIKGSLRREDALKLYELAYFSNGSILELGCNHGLSTSIMAGAVRDAAGKKVLKTIDLVEKYVNRTRNTLEGLGLSKYVEVNCGDAIQFCDKLLGEESRFALAFVDHSHEYSLVYEAAVRVADLLMPGGFCLFHDFHDARNIDSQNHLYGVAQGVLDGLKNKPFQFFGVFGCAALYRKNPSKS